MLDHSDRKVQFPNRFRVVKVPGTEDTYDVFPVPGEITNEGGTANEAFFDSIDVDIKARLAIESKATSAEAIASTDDTKYMTPLKTKDAIDAMKGVLYTGIDLSASKNTTISLTQYLTEKVRKLEININVMFAASPNIVMNGTNIRVGIGGKDGGTVGSRELANRNFGYVVGVLSIYPESNTYTFIGQGAGNTTSDKFDFEDFGTFESLTSLVFGAKYDASHNFDTQIGIYQYLK